MAINTRNDMLYFEFKFNGQRCREYTKLKDTTDPRQYRGQQIPLNS